MFLNELLTINKFENSVCYDDLQPPSDADTSPELSVATDQLQCQVQDDLCPGWHPHHDDQCT